MSREAIEKALQQANERLIYDACQCDSERDGGNPCYAHDMIPPVTRALVDAVLEEAAKECEAQQESHRAYAKDAPETSEAQRCLLMAAGAAGQCADGIRALKSQETAKP